MILDVLCEGVLDCRKKLHALRRKSLERTNFGLVRETLHLLYSDSTAIVTFAVAVPLRKDFVAYKDSVDHLLFCLEVNRGGQQMKESTIHVFNLSFALRALCEGLTMVGRDIISMPL